MREKPGGVKVLMAGASWEFNSGGGGGGEREEGESGGGGGGGGGSAECPWRSLQHQHHHPRRRRRRHFFPAAASRLYVFAWRRLSRHRPGWRHVASTSSAELHLRSKNKIASVGYTNPCFSIRTPACDLEHLLTSSSHH
ncbi:uncharacterized protein PHA67_009129 isoform 1-T1 [Liasis olivaceus]